MIIVLPLCNKDAIAAIKNLAWMFELDGKTTFECLLAWPEGTRGEFIERMRANAAKVFARVHEIEYPEATETTWPAGCNWAWQSVARYIPMVTNYKGNSSPLDKVFPTDTPWLFLEADAVPLKPGWMQTLWDEYKRGDKPFMGHIVQDMGHMNGVAVYPNHVSMYARDAFHVVHSAWDVALREQTIDITHNANHLIQHCWCLRNNDTPMHNGDGPVASFRDVGHMHRILAPGAVLFHRTKDGSLIDCLMQAKAGSIPLTLKEVNAIGAALEKESEPIANPRVGSGGESVGEPKPAVADSPGPIPKTAIFIVTFYKDAEWLKYCLASIKRFATGFLETVVVFPDRDVDVLQPICEESGIDNIMVDTFTEAEGKGMINHMAIEMLADEYCFSDYVLHLDSDCIFTEPVTPGDYFVDGKPVLLIEHYDRFIDRYPTILQWKVTSEKALKFKCEFECMRRHPAVHRRDLYPRVRQRIEKAHGMPFLEYVLSVKPTFPQGISEYNVLGAYAHKEMHDFYHFVDLATDMRPKDKIVQFWSHGGLDRPTDTGPYVPETPRAIIKKVLGI